MIARYEHSQRNCTLRHDERAWSMVSKLQQPSIAGFFDIFKQCCFYLKDFHMLHNSIVIKNGKKWLVTGIPPTQLKKLLKLHRKKSNNWPMVSFTHNRDEITTWLGAQLQKQKHNIQSNIFKITASFLNFKQLSTRTLELYSNSLKQLFLQLNL